MDNALTHIELLRHGRPEGEQCFRGHSEFALTESGWQQMYKAVAGLTQVDVVITSPRIRCQAFAKLYASDQKTPLVIEPGFQELNFGDWDGKEKQAVWDQNQAQLMAFWDDPWATTPPNGERLVDFDQRIEAAWKAVLERYQGKRILLVTHGGVIKQIIRQNLNMPRDGHYLQRMNIPYGARVSMSVYRDEHNKLWPQLLWPEQD